MLDVEVDSLLVGVHPDLHGIVDRPAYDASSTAAMPGVSKQHPPLHRNKDVEQTDCRRSHVGVEDVEVGRGGGLQYIFGSKFRNHECGDPVGSCRHYIR